MATHRATSGTSGPTQRPDIPHTPDTSAINETGVSPANICGSGVSGSGVSGSGVSGSGVSGAGGAKTGHKAQGKGELELMLKGYGLTTAEFFYRMPDHLNVLNTFVWQDYDLAPDHPRLFGFIEYWQKNLEGPLHSVRFTHRKMIGAGEWRNVVGEFRLH